MAKAKTPKTEAVKVTPVKETPAKKSKKAKTADHDGSLGFEATLWSSADKLRSNMDAAEYKHVVLGRNCTEN